MQNDLHRKLFSENILNQLYIEALCHPDLYRCTSKRFVIFIITDADLSHRPDTMSVGQWSNMFSRTREFSETFRAFPVSMLPGNERENVVYGGKIILPPSSLSKLASLNITYPMLFELNNDLKAKSTHAGVLEFIAEEGRVYIPLWMMKSLGLETGNIVHVKSTSLPLGRFVKIQPQSVDFLDITDPKAVLEQSLRNFSTLTLGDIITIKYNSKFYDILILETKPLGRGISIVETDLEVDFAPPLGYVEPSNQREYQPRSSTTSIREHTFEDEAMGFKAFAGQGVRLSGKSKNDSYNTGEVVVKEGIPEALRLPPGKFFFGYKVKPLKTEGSEESSVFKGKGTSLREARLKT